MAYITYMTEAQIKAKLANEMMRFPSLRQAAKAWGFTPAYISDIMTGRRGISDKIARIVGYRRVEPNNAPYFVKEEV